MARALGWGMTARPYVTIAGGRPDAGGPDPMAVGGSGARQTIATEREAGRWEEPALVMGRRPNAAIRTINEPAPTLTGSHDTPHWHESAEAAGRFLLDRRQTGAPVIDGGVEPSPTLTITEAEGGILQGFPADYRWEGSSKGKRWEQIGNVVCPPVARRVVAELLGVDAPPLPWHGYAFTPTLDTARRRA